MPNAGYVYKAVSSQLAEMDEMDVPEKEWNIFDMAFLETSEVISALLDSGVPSHQALAEQLQTIVDRENDWDEDEFKN